MVSPVSEFLADLRATGLCAIIRASTPGAAVPVGRALLESGVRILEVTLTTPDADEAIRELAGDAPDGCWVGAGTVISEGDVERAQGLGARFIVTPAICPAVAPAASAGLPSLAGAWTASEVLTGMSMGATAIKIFPASSGGPEHIKALRDPLPDVPLVAVGGVGVEELPRYREVGAVACGVGGPLIGDAVRGGSLDALRERAARFVELAAS